MKQLYNHYRSRFVRMFLTTGVLLLGFIFSSWNHYRGNVKYLNGQTYEEIYGDKFTQMFILFTALILILQFVLMYRDYNIAKTRLLLLPQRRCTIIFADILFLFIMLLLLYGLCLGLYYLGFHAFIDTLNEHEIVNFAQTKNMWISLKRTPMLAYLFPKDGIGNLRMLSVGAFLCTFTVSLVSVLLLEKDMMKQLLICFAICVFTGICLYTFCDTICLLIVLSAVVYMWKQTGKAWSDNLIGG